MTRVFACSTDFTLSFCDTAILLESICEKRLARSKQLIRPEDRLRSVLAGALARYAVSLTLRAELATIRLEKDEHGKPFVPDSPDLHLSLSHAGSWIACSVSDAPTGIDVEYKRGAHMDVASSFFALGERAWLAEAASPDERTERFYAIWTAKESYTKAVGLGLGLGLRSFETSTSSTPAAIVERDGTSTGFVIHRVEIDPEHACALCTREDERDIWIECSTDRDLVAFYRSNARTRSREH